MIRILAVALCVGFLGLPAGANEQAPKEDVATNPQRQLLAALAAIVSKQPRHVGAIYIAARTAAQLGDDTLASQWLDRLAEVGLDDELDPDDFGAFALTPAYRERAARFAATAPPVGKADSVTELHCRDLLPEGTAWDPKRREVLLSSGRRRTVVAVDTAGACRDVVPSGDGGLLAVLGMSVDAASDSLWVASAAAPFMVDAKSSDAGRALLSRIDLARGKVAASYALPGPGLLNDLALASDGSVYVTDSRGGTIYRLPRNGTALSALFATDTFESPNGIVALPGGQLLVADFGGLALVVDPAGRVPRVERLATPNDLYLGGIDGLALSDGRVIGIQNLVGRSRIWALTVDPKQYRVTSARVLMRGHPDFLNPTTGVVVDGRFLFIADTRLQSATPAGGLTDLPAGRSGHRLLELSLGAPR